MWHRLISRFFAREVISGGRMVSRINYDMLKSFISPAVEKRHEKREPETAVLKSQTSSQKRWSLKPSTDPTSSLPSFYWTKNRHS
jgi:hypothetical protein